MFTRKLRALEYSNCDHFDPENVTEFRNLIVWLEDQKIRHYKIEDREPLRIVYSDKWDAVFDQYLKDVSCPFAVNEKVRVIDWLLGFSLRLQYEDEMDLIERKGENGSQTSNAPKVVASNPFDRLDFNSAEFKEGVSKLAQLLKVPEHPDHLVTLEAISVLVEKLSISTEKDKTTSMNKTNKSSSVSIEKVGLGFETGDVVLNRAAKVLRLLHIDELRSLQTQINELIVAVQSLTANPKTDTALAKVGRDPKNPRL